MSPILIAGLVLGGILVASRAMAMRTDVNVPPQTPLGEATLAVARVELGVTEDLGHNDGARIRDYWEGTTASPPSNWCAAFTRFCMHVASAESGFPLVVEGSIGAKATMGQFVAAGRWLSADFLRAHPEVLVAGMVPVWDRSIKGRPETSWWGHIGVCSEGPTSNDGKFSSVEGNSGPTGEQVFEMSRDVHDPRFLGAGVL